METAPPTTYTVMLTAALFIKPSNWKSPKCPSTHKEIKHNWSAPRNEILLWKKKKKEQATDRIQSRSETQKSQAGPCESDPTRTTLYDSVHGKFKNRLHKLVLKETGTEAVRERVETAWNGTAKNCPGQQKYSRSCPESNVSAYRCRDECTPIVKTQWTAP